MADRRTTVRRTKGLDATPLGGDRFEFIGRLTDRAMDGDFAGDAVTIHDFSVTGVVEGARLTLSQLHVAALAHPYDDCPFAVPPTRNLIGCDIASGWRSAVLSTLGGTRGCTHVNTLLLGLSELTTMVVFLRINSEVAYTPETRRDGRWTGVASALMPALPGACLALRRDGSVIRAAPRHLNGPVDQCKTLM